MHSLHLVSSFTGRGRSASPAATNGRGAAPASTPTAARTADTGLIAASPVQAIASEYDAAADALERIDPQSPSIATYRHFAYRLAAAIADGRQVDTYLCIDQVASRLRMRPSRIRRLCRQHRAAIGAAKTPGREWTIHWPTFEAAWTGGIAGMRVVA